MLNIFSRTKVTPGPASRTKSQTEVGTLHDLKQCVDDKPLEEVE